MGDTVSSHSAEHRSECDCKNCNAKDSNKKQDSPRMRRSNATKKQKRTRKLNKTICNEVKNKIKKSESTQKIEQGSSALLNAVPIFSQGTSTKDVKVAADDSNDDNYISNVRKMDTVDALHLLRQKQERKADVKMDPVDIVEPTAVANLEELNRNPFFNYLRELRRKHKGLTVVELAVRGGKNWRGMSREEKFPYVVMAQRYREYRLKRLQAKPSATNTDDTRDCESETKQDGRKRTRKSTGGPKKKQAKVKRESYLN